LRGRRIARCRRVIIAAWLVVKYVFLGTPRWFAVHDDVIGSGVVWMHAI
jgi:hypothetical protein